MAAPEKVSEAAELTLLEMLDLLEKRIDEMRSLPARKKPAKRKRLTLVKKLKAQAAKKTATQQTESATPAKALPETSMRGKRQALGKSLLQLRKSTPHT